MFKNFHWGKRIALALGLFLLANVFLVIFILQQNDDLVVQDYYEQGLSYEEQIKKERNVEGPMSLSPVPQGLLLKLPDAQKGFTPSGTVFFMHPKDASKDFSFPLSVDSLGTQIISIDKMQKGAWNFRVDWSAAGKEYSYKNRIFI